ncbi:BsuBI/PstI family type II restriction endonuclease [Prevotella denticola]|uniref:BsuBI/PstI family type II restriction endonuclease n=1 Tax=Prevotella denticola TaxID=28129 RepID=UPI00201B0147|nr:BsuBI/PstI family type II restriction endonuclease [Prevotella denticola]
MGKTFDPGSHNRLQKAILEEFAPRFAPGSECLYVDDTTHRDMVNLLTPQPRPTNTSNQGLLACQPRPANTSTNACLEAK